MRVLSTICGCEATAAEYPVAIFFEPLFACNLWCRYCYVGADNNHKAPVVKPLAELEPVMAKIGALTDEVILLGGEPSLHPEFLGILKYFKDHGVSSVGALTNGARINDQTAAALAELGCWLNVSLRGAKRETFDFLAGKDGAQEMAYRAIDALGRAGVEVGLEYDCTPHTYTELKAAVEDVIARGVKVSQLQLHRVYETEDSPGGIRLHLDPQQWNTVFAQAAELTQRHQVPVFLEDELPLCAIDEAYHEFITRCSCESNILVVDPNGGARRYFFSEETVGNLFTDDIETIMARVGASRARPPAAAPGSCAACGMVESCLGGWMAAGGERLNLPWSGFQADLQPAMAA